MNNIRNPFYFVFAFFVLLFGSINAYAQTSVTSGVTYATSTTATLWMKPAATVDWVDAHYNAGAGQQNIRMTYNSANARYETVINATVGTVVSSSFTYAINGLAYDTGTFTATVIGPGSSSSSSKSSVSSSSVKTSSSVSSVIQSSSSSTSSSVISGLTNGVQDNGASAVIWLKPNNISVSWVDVHYNQNNTGQQNVRMTYNSSAARYEQVITTGSSLSLTYSFTYQTPTGAYDTATFNYARSSSSFSSIKSSSSSSSSRSSVNTTSESSSSSIRSSIGSSSSVGSSLSSAYVQGAIDLGATTTIWFKSSINQTGVILHYSVGTGNQINPTMTFNTSTSRWESVISPVSPNVNIHYSFTHNGGAGNLDSVWYDHLVNGDCKTCPPKPTFSPLGGKFYAPQNVTLSTSVTGGVIRYTLDGSAPNSTSPKYTGTPIYVPKAATINAITIDPQSQESQMASETYVVDKAPGTLNAPTFSLDSGTYNTIIRVSLASDTQGAYIHYTTDGTDPTENSRVYSTPIEVKIDTTKTPNVNTTQIKAIATKPNWTTSAVSSKTYTITSNTNSTWNGLTTFNVVNGTKGKFADSQVYWAIIGKDWNTDQFVHVDMNGNLIPMSQGDNKVMKNGKLYANYFYSLAETKKITIPAINSARLLMSVGSPMYIWVNTDVNGKIGYAGANVENPDDPNIDVTFDFGEFAIIGKDKPYQGIFINTTRVDLFGFPIQLTVNGLDGFSQTVGEPLTETRDELFARFINETPAEFHSLAQAPYAPYRIMAPAHATFQTGGPNVNYLSNYIDSVWEQYRHQNLVLNLQNGWPTFTGHVEGDVFIFTDGQGTYRINGKPTTSMAMLGNGLLDDSSGATGLVRDKQLQLQAQVCAALNRHVAHLDGSKWYDSASFFPAGQAANFYTKFWHDHALNGLTYGFSYDDVGGYSPSIYTATPQSVTYTIGW